MRRAGPGSDDEKYDRLIKPLQGPALVPHRNAPLSDEGQHRLVQRCQRRPIAHVTAEMGISRACAST